jgi:YD repeat-containing protein
VASNAFGCQRLTIYDLENQGTNMVDANTITNKYTYDALGRIANGFFLPRDLTVAATLNWAA